MSSRRRIADMGRGIKFHFTESGVYAVATLLEREAPKTCEAIWKALEKPARNKAIHAMFCGPEAEFDLPRENQVFDGAAIPRENPTIFPQPGDVGFGYVPPYALPQYDVSGPPDEPLYDVAVFYGPAAFLLVPAGLFPVNIFARIEEGLRPFAEMCARLHTEGVKEMEVSRVMG
jgi:hypothetical protein